MVFEAVDGRGTRGALKILHTHLAAYPDVRARFAREVTTLARVRHQDVVRALHADLDAPRPFLVMEHVTGESLQENLIRRGAPFDASTAARLVAHLLEILHHVHRAGVLHRDLTPANVLLTREGSLKLVDFGLSRLLAPNAEEQLTQAGAWLGTPAYLAPELLRAGEADARTDVWGAGAVLYTLLSGLPPRTATTVAAALKAAGREPPPPIARVVAGLPPAVAAVVDRALSVQPADRYRSARTMRAALLRAVAPSAPRRAHALLVRLFGHAWPRAEPTRLAPRVRRP